MKVTPEIVRELLHYDPETGAFTWRERDRRWFKSGRDCRAWNTRYAGNRAGRVWIGRYGYQSRMVGLLGWKSYEHHLAWMWMTDEPLPEQVDHKNRDGRDNRWCNLRASTVTENGRNQSLSRRNTSGTIGVTWDRRAGMWKAQCRIDGQQQNLGNFHDIEEARCVAREFRAAHGFDPGHGQQVAHYHAP
ncbi:hypothetical protein EQG41_18285 [Billgrantia azerbaijanica]|nr:hypothetical protein EQG41_18285 [Halomonas azerbaijanica]